MLLRVLQYIEGLLGYVTLRCCQMLRFPKFCKLPKLIKTITVIFTRVIQYACHPYAIALYNTCFHMLVWDTLFQYY